MQHRNGKFVSGNLEIVCPTESTDKFFTCKMSHPVGGFIIILSIQNKGDQKCSC